MDRQRKSLHVKLEPHVRDELFATADDHGITVAALVEATLVNTDLNNMVTDARAIMVGRNQYRRT